MFPVPKGTSKPQFRRSEYVMVGLPEPLASAQRCRGREARRPNSRSA